MSDLSSLEVAVSPAEKFREYLATQNQRLTPERRNIVEEVFSSHEHFDADQLVHRLSSRKDNKRVSRSSVYRCLDAMVKAGLLRKVARTNDRDVYEHDYGYPQHDHMICTKTGKMIEFENEEILAILERVASEHGFRITGHRLEVYGICAEAAKSPRRRPRKLDLI
ncbi:MAG: transcriptional repressor [Planctomycetaceae bacterium]|nr:transcriptional repressor [Planctomycetaceae bacterium]